MMEEVSIAVTALVSSWTKFTKRTDLKINTLNHLKSFTTLAELRQSLQQTGGGHLRVIASEQHSSFTRNVAALVSLLTDPWFEPRTSRSRNYDVPLA